MHVPDGFLDAPTSVATGVVAVAGVALALRGARRELDDRTAPMAGLVATFVFAAQMINFPVGAGTSGHLLGGALAAVLVGPWSAVLCMSVVLIVQALLMADGGITALGTNITLMALVGVWVGWGVFVLVRRLLPRRTSSVVPAAVVGALASVPAAAAVFSLLFAIGGIAPVDPGTVLGAMVTWHVVIGIGEAVVTGLVVASVVATRPDLVRGARPALETRELEIRSDRPVKQRTFLALGLLVCLLLAGVASYYASAHPDGLEHVAEQTGFIDTAEDSATADSPLADYSTRGVEDARLSGGIAGVVGVVVMLLLSTGLFWGLRRRGDSEDSAEDAEPEDAPTRTDSRT